MTFAIVKIRKETAQFVLCLLAAFLSGRILLLNISLKFKFVFLAALGIAALMIIFQKPKQILLFILVITTPYYFSKVLIDRGGHIGLAQGTSISLSDVIALSLFLIFLAELALRQTEILFFPLIMIPAIAWLAFSGLSILSAPDRELVVVQLLNMIKLMVICWIVANSIKDDIDMSYALAGLMLGMLSQAFLGIYQGITGHPLGLLSGSQETIDGILRQELSIGQVNRVSGNLSHPNAYAMYLTSIIPFVLALLFSKIRLLFKVFAGAAACLGCLALTFSLSRSSWINFAVIVSIIFFLAFRRRQIIPRASRWIASAAFIVLLGLFLSRADIIVSRFKSDDRGSSHGRIQMAQTAMVIIKDYPLVGVGLNNYSLVSPRYDTSLYVIHNAFLLIAVETGLFSLIAFLGLIVILLTQTWRVIIRAPSEAIWVSGVGVFCAFVALALHSMVDYNLLSNPQLRTHFWLLVGLSAALIHGIDQKGRGFLTAYPYLNPEVGHS
jgi:O-antigen ligase